MFRTTYSARAWVSNQALHHAQPNLAAGKMVGRRFTVPSFGASQAGSTDRALAQDVREEFGDAAVLRPRLLESLRAAVTQYRRATGQDTVQTRTLLYCLSVVKGRSRLLTQNTCHHLLYSDLSASGRLAPVNAVVTSMLFNKCNQIFILTWLPVLAGQSEAYRAADVGHAASERLLPCGPAAATAREACQGVAFVEPQQIQAALEHQRMQASRSAHHQQP